MTGFDIDPLAVALAKTTWVLALADEIKAATHPVVIPIFHADLSFAITPVSASLPMHGEGDTIEITLDGETIEMPAAIVQPEHREIFDRMVDWAYDEARDLSGSNDPTLENAKTLVSGVASAAASAPSEELQNRAATSLLTLALRMKTLARANRNGIWAFILRKTDRPALLAGQFNGLVSNPPWLAMSALADNPYRQDLTNVPSRTVSSQQVHRFSISSSPRCICYTLSIGI